MFALSALALVGVHLCWILLLPRPEVGSNVIQLCLPILVVCLAAQQARATSDATGRFRWYALASAFAIWTLAQGLYLYFLFAPPVVRWPVRADDVLWLLFGLPLLLVLTNSRQEADHVTWLDRAQTVLFFAVLYILVLVPAQRLAVDKAYLIQNLALVLCCLFRLPTCETARERRFFIRLGMFLLLYTATECIGEQMYRHGWHIGGVADLCWSVPNAFFVLVTAFDVEHRGRESKSSGFLRETASALRSVNSAAMTFLAIGVSALLMPRSPVIGWMCIATGFALFAMRTSARERLWLQAHGRLKESLLQDALTGLGNRLELRRALAERLPASGEGSIVLFFVDLDRFKQVNDSLGHALGDRLLIEVGRRLVLAAESDAAVCRLGGDEFVVLTKAADASAARAAGEAMLEALHVPMQLGTHQFCCSASIGVVVAAPEDDADGLLRTADHAMYRAKQTGRDRVQLFDAALRADLNSRRQLETELRVCIATNAIDVAFQPIYCVEEGSICGFEALARWDHPVLGSVPPGDFIPLAEESGLILTLGAQILEKACGQMATWNRTWGTELSVSVNVSPRQFGDPGLIPMVLATLERGGLSAQLLRLEITETALVLRDGTVRDTLAQARAHGIRISLDDFGTGYSSLSFLLSLPVDEVKVDRSFVSHMYLDPDRSELVRTVVHLGHSLGKRVVAEGVETEQDLLDLAGMGCECVQGYLISKPLSVAAIEADVSAILARVQPSLARSQPPAGHGASVRAHKGQKAAIPAVREFSL